MMRRSKTAIPRSGTTRSPRGIARRPGKIAVGRLIGLVAQAFDRPAVDIVDEIARMAAAPKGEDSDPTRETILSYIKDPKWVVVEGKRVRRRNRLTPIHHKFAHLVINYLDGRRAGNTHVGVPQELADSTPWRDARKLCKQVLQTERERRYERPLGSDPGAQATIGLLTGVYAVCRRESSDGRYHQELLILRNSGTKNVPRCHCTYVTTKVVTRGEWMLIGNVIYCSMSGLREDNSHEIGGLYLAHLTDHDLLSGFLAGAGTDVKIPVAMPVVATKVPEANRSILELGDLGDEAILRAYGNVKADIEGIAERLHDILAEQIKPVVFRASVCNPLLRHAFDGSRLLIDPRFREFCKSSIS